VITTRDNGVFLVYKDGDQWIKENIWNPDGQQLTPAIGDLIPEKPGNEILVVGLSSGTEDDDPGDGTAVVLYKEDSVWKNIRAYTESKLIHGCDIGDLDPDHPGVEADLTTFNYTAVAMWWDGNEFQTEMMFKDSHNVRKAVIADIVDYHEGNEVVCISKSGNATLAYGTAGNWTIETIYSGDPLARVAVGDLDSQPGLEVYVGRDVAREGGVIGIRWDGSEWTNTTVFVDTAKNRGVWVGDVDPDVPGAELYSFGYSLRLVQISDPFGTSKATKDLFMDTARGHEIRVGDIDPSKDGNEIAIVGYSSNLTIVSLKDEGEDVIPTISGGDSIALSSGEETTLDLTVVGDTYMSFKATGFTGATVKLNMESIFIKGSPILTVIADNVNEDINETITLTLSYPGGTVTKNVAVSITGDKTVPSASSTITPEEKITWEETVEVTLTETVTKGSFDTAVAAGDIELSVDGEDQDVTFILSPDGQKISFTMTEEITRGDATLTVSGLSDISGNEMEEFVLDFVIEEEPEEENNYTWFIILLVVVFIILIVVIAVVIVGRGKKDEEDSQDIPEKVPDE